MTYKEAARELGEWYGGFANKPSEEAIKVILEGLQKLDEINLFIDLQKDFIESLCNKDKYHNEFANGYLMAILNIQMCLENPNLTWREPNDERDA